MLTVKLFFLLIVSIFLTLGMIFLPPLTGTGIGSHVARAWLALGLLVFAGYYLSFLEQEKRGRWLRMSGQIKAGTRFASLGERITGQN